MNLLEFSKPWVLKSLFKRWSLLPIFLKQLLYDIFGLRGNCVPWLETKVWCVLDSLSSDFLVFLVVEWENSTQEKVGDDSQTPQIYFLSVWLLEQDFWGDIGERSEWVQA